MDATLTLNQQKALEMFLDAMVGEQPSILDHGHGAEERRRKRAEAREWLHKFATLSMRIGAQRARAALGMEFNKEALPIWKDPGTGAEEVKTPIPDGLDKVVTH